MPTRRRWTLYVINLKKSILNSPRFREANPQYTSKKPCVYVGLTYLTDEERYVQHMTGIKSSRVVKKFGRRLRKSETRLTRPMARKKGLQKESEYADELRQRGWGVWSN